MIVTKREESEISEIKIIDQMRSVGIDMIKEAGSGHSGIVLGAAPILYALYAHHMMIDPENPNYYNRDRFIMSAGHGSALLYTTLYMAGFDISLDDLRNFRQIDSITPGHPEYMKTPGVDCSTGLLGQGFANAVGISIAESNLEARFNKGKSNSIIDFYTYVLCGDGDLEEGISYEAASLAGVLGLKKLIVLYDNNGISLDGSTSYSFRDDIPMRFISLGWNVLTVDDGEDYLAISHAIEDAKTSDKPTLINVKTTIGKYSKYEGTNLVHGSLLDELDINSIKEKMGIRNIPFTISQTVVDDFRYFVSKRCKNLNAKFIKSMETMGDEDRKYLEYLMNTDKSLDMNDLIYEAPDNAIESPRDTSSKVLNSIVSSCPNILGGSADLFIPTKTYINDMGDFSANNYLGKNIYFGVREHAMGAILNGISLMGYRSYGSTFLAFSDYMRPAIRMAAIMKLPVTYILTHDSISIGEDGPTHQAVEHLASLRMIPNLEVFRPCDANEVIGTYKAILSKKDGPSIISLSKSELEILPTTSVSNTIRGGYTVFDNERKPSGIIISTGEEVHLAIEVAKRLQTKGIDIRVVSMPCIDRFKKQGAEYIESVLPVEVRKIVIEAGSSISWNSIVFNEKYLITLDTFGNSGKKCDVYKKFGFDLDTLEKRVEELLK